MSSFLGISNVVASFIQSYPVTGSFSRSADVSELSCEKHYFVILV